MTSPPKRPIISLKFKTPDPAQNDAKPTGPSAKPDSVPARPSFVPQKSTFVPAGKPAVPTVKSVFGKPSARPAPVAAPAPPPPPPAPPAPKAKGKKSGPSIAPELFKAAVKSAGMAIQNVVADPDWKDEELFHQYQTAKLRASSTQKHQAKLVSTVATRRHSKNIEQADVESPAMRAAYAAALVALVGPGEGDAETTQPAV